MRRTCAVLLLAIAACFEEPALDECPTGAAGCDCQAGVCGNELECIASIDKCVPIDCDPGTRNCTCADGEACFEPLTCMRGVCKDVASTTGVADGSGSASTQTTAAASESTAATSSATGVDESSSTTGETLPDPRCIACVQSQWVGGSACFQHFDQCQSDEGCAGIHTCYVAGGTLASCCEDMCGLSQMTWNGFLACVNGQCGDCDVVPMLACPGCGG